MKFKRLLSFLLAATLLVSLAGCSTDPQESTPPTTVPTAGEKVTYTITVVSAGGVPMAGLSVYIYGDDSLDDIKQFGETNENGVAQITVTRGSTDVAVIAGAPKGYAVDAFYPLLSVSTTITLRSSLITDGSLTEAQLGLGDVMYDFTVTECGGEQITLSDLLAEKDMVLLNFWFEGCDPCRGEFPYMEEAYQMYQDRVAIVAMNPLDGTTESVAAYKETMGLSFYMAACPASWSSSFGITAYPTSIVIDRYGVICLIEAGSIQSLSPFTSIFEHFSGENYQQKICEGGIEDIIIKVKPTYTMPSSEEVEAVLNQGGLSATYSAAEGNDAEYNWPFILGEKEGEQVAYASNQGIDNSYSIMHINVHLEAGEALGFEYLTSCENGADILYVLVNGEDIYQISGVSDGTWEKCYPWVALTEGDYEVSLCYLKDGTEAAGDDTVYIKNVHALDASKIDVASYIPRQAATTEDGFEYSYVDVVLNPEDGYYHVGSADGPLLLAMLNYVSQFNEELSVLQIISDTKSLANQYYDAILPYCSYGSNSSLPGVCTVNAELAEYLKLVAQVAGFDGTENEWLKICSYYDAYGTDGAQLVDPIAGLAPFSAFTATEGKNVETNYYYYDRTIIPRGLFAKFVPTTSGVYRITSRTDTNSSLEGWIFDRDGNEVMVYQMDERLYGDENNVSMVLYMQAGVEYFIDICFWDLYETGYIYYDIEYVAPEYYHFRLASPGFFTYDTNATGENMYYTIAGGVTPILIDGKYYVDLGDGKVGSLLYVDFTGFALFNMPLVDMIEMGGFDFSKTEDDETVLYYMSLNENDPEKTREYLKELWGEDYEAYAENFQLEDVMAGKFHGDGLDYTEQIRSYLDRLETEPLERQGCVAMDEQLAEILQNLMDKYTFAGVDHSWIKLCYYYDYMGPEE